MTDTDDPVCAMTICPYLGVNDGSPWTGARDDECTADCEWHDNYDDGYGGCIAADDVAADILRSYDGDKSEIDDMERPPCQYADRCQWQQQCDGPCPPRLAVMTNQDEFL